MRLFDLIGACAVVAWLSVVGAYVYQNNFSTAAEDLGTSAIFTEGESWMLLTREEQDVGYIHEARTSLDTGGWLLEYDLLMNVSMLGIDQYLRTEIRASVDRDARLNQFRADITTGGTSFSLQGEVDGTTVVMKMDLAGEAREQRIQLNEAPRLANSALNQLVAKGDELKPGTRFEQEYFDPTVMGMTKMTFEYVRQHEVDVFEEKIPTYHFRQLVGGNELDVYVDENGEVYIQEFPLRIIGARLPKELGRSRAQALRREFDKSSDSGGDVDLSVETAVGLLKGSEALGNISKGTHRYRLNNIPEGTVLQLDSGTQSVIRKAGTSAEIDTAISGKPDSVTEAQLEPYLEKSIRIDFDSEPFAELVDVELPETNTLKAELIARMVRRKMEVAGEVGIQTASQALEKGSGDCTEFSLVLVAALRRYDVPARFVSGVKLDEKQNFIPHQWVQYWTEEGFVDVDATTDTMLPGTGQLQLFTHAKPEHPDYVHALDQLQIEPFKDEASSDPTGTKSDFN